MSDIEFLSLGIGIGENDERRQQALADLASRLRAAGIELRIDAVPTLDESAILELEFSFEGRRIEVEACSFDSSEEEPSG